MPTYVFKNKNNGEESEVFLKISEKDQYLIDHPELEAVLSSNPLIDPIRLGITKTSPTFRDLLKRAHDTVGGNHRYHGA